MCPLPLSLSSAAAAAAAVTSARYKGEVIALLHSVRLAMTRPGLREIGSFFHLVFLLLLLVAAPRPAESAIAEVVFEIFHLMIKVLAKVRLPNLLSFLRNVFFPSIEFIFTSYGPIKA
ncbi:unnamed protein product [Hydatigera taeniaeformis]|uniref:Secreted protein n=1 Tax=Hydatigena taeniaeformis TaxID=6205 RepID=A0A0R3WW95_HYDTA|nr:unnamed protein product [Hydatigera taeniaeformis]